MSKERCFMFRKQILPVSIATFVIMVTGCTKVIKVVEKPVIQKVRVEAPKPEPKPEPKPKERFVPVCLSTLSGCKEIRDLKTKIAKLNALIQMRDEEFKDLITTYFNELDPSELSPQAAVESKYSKRSSGLENLLRKILQRTQL